MKKRKISFLILGLLSIINVSAQETIKVMFYNLLNYPLEDAVQGREQDLFIILGEYQPDLFLVCELNNFTGANSVLNITRAAIDPNFEMATYVSNTSDDNFGNQNDLQNLLYYNSSKFSIEEEVIVPTDLRDFNVYRIRLNTIDQDTNPIDVYIIVCHLKASSGPTNAQRRFEMVTELDSYLETLPSDSNILLGGDLNIYTSSEPAFQELIDPNDNITFVDPANRIGSWHNNSNFIDVFTQSTRTQPGLGGTTGGFDDRFDFILTSENMISTAAITYVPNSYQVYGNNGLTSCYNSAINSSNCGNLNSTFSQEIRDSLHNFSDHLPVTLSLEADVALSTDEYALKSHDIVLINTLVDSKLNIYINQPQLFNKAIYIYNNLGQLVKILQTNSNKTQTFNIVNLRDGVYFLRFSEPNSKALKFVVSH